MFEAARLFSVSEEADQVAQPVRLHLIDQDEHRTIAPLFGIFQNIIGHTALFGMGFNIGFQSLLDRLLFPCGFRGTQIIFHIEAQRVAARQQQGAQPRQNGREPPPFIVSACSFTHLSCRPQGPPHSSIIPSYCMVSGRESQGGPANVSTPKGPAETRRPWKLTGNRPRRSQRGADPFLPGHFCTDRSPAVRCGPSCRESGHRAR